MTTSLIRWVRFALRNTLRNRRRSLATVTLTALGSAAILIGGGFALYTYESLQQAAARDTGHLIVAGSLLVFIPAVGEYVIPELLAGPSQLNIGRVMWNEFFLNLDWQRASAVAIVMIMLILLPIAVFNKYQTKALEGAR